MVKKISLILFLYFFSFSALADPGSELSPQDLEKLKKGDVVIKTGYRAPGVPEEMGSQIAAIVQVKAPLERVWNILSDWKNYERIIPNVQEVKLIEEEENRFLLYFNLSFSVKSIEYYLNYYFFKDKNLVTFQLDKNKKNDFKRFHGYFKFDPVPDNPERVQVVYSVDVELGKYFPEFIKSYFAKKDMPKVIANLKKWVELKKAQPKN
jgi:carbon monoxide dehydrogenase subunit G